MATLVLGPTMSSAPYLVIKTALESEPKTYLSDNGSASTSASPLKGTPLPPAASKLPLYAAQETLVLMNRGGRVAGTEPGIDDTTGAAMDASMEEEEEESRYGKGREPKVDGESWF